MANEIDNRVVQMQFDNAQFERGVSTSINTLDKLKSSLKMDGVAKGFDKIQSLGNSIHFDSLYASLETVGHRFSVLEIAAITAIQNITNRAVDAGIRLAKSLSVDQIAAGWAKFADKAQSVGTIMSATGESVEYVGAQLDILNRYTDETSASFTDMTRNIGKFTNAGVPLEDAVKAMQGITNWAYKSGASVNEAGRAMYNLSQAMAVGTVKLIDWRSIENANMATIDFKQNVIDTAVAMGTLKKSSKDGEYYVKGYSKAIVTAKNFNSELSRGWFSSEVLKSTLEKYGDFSTDIIALADTTGQTVTDYMQYVKDYEKGILDFGELSRIVGVDSDELRRNFLLMGTASESVARRLATQRLQAQGLKITEENLELKTSLVQKALEKAYVDSKNGITDFSDALNETGLRTKDLLKIFEEMDANQTLGIGAFRAAQEYRSLADALEATKDAVSTGWMKTFELLFGNYEEAKRVWGSIGEMLYEIFAEAGNERNAMLLEWHNSDFGGYEDFADAIESISNALIGLKDLIDDVFGDFFDWFDVGFLNDLTSKFKRFGRDIYTIFTGEIQAMENPFEMLKEVDDSNIVNKIGKDLENLTEFDVGDVQEFRDSLIDVTNLNYYEDFKDFLSDIHNIISAIADGVLYVKDAFTPVSSSIVSAGSSALKTIRNVVDTVSYFIDLTDKNRPSYAFADNEERAKAEKLVGIIEKLETIVNGAVSAFNLLKDIAGQVWETFKMFWDPIVTIGEDVLNLVTAIANRFISLDETNNEQNGILGFFNKLRDKLGPIVEWITDLIHGLIVALTNIIDPDTGGDLSEFGETFSKIFSGIGNILRKIFPIISKIGEFIGTIIGGITEKIGDFMQNATLTDFINLINGGLAAGIGGGLLNITNNLSKVSDKVPKIANPIKSLIGLLTGKKQEVSEASGSPANGKSFWSSLTDGVTGFLDKISDSLKKAIDVQSIKTFASAILMIAGALFLLSLIDFVSLSNALVAIVGAVAAIGLAMNAFSKYEFEDAGKMIAGAVAFGIMASGILILSAALAVLALIPYKNLLFSLLGLTVGLFVMVDALEWLSDASPKILVGALALTVMAPALLALAAALAVLALIPIDKIGPTVILFGAAVAIMAIALGNLAAAGPMVLAAASALLMFAPAVDLMVLALIALSFVPFTHMLTAMLGFAAGLAVMVLALSALAAVGPMSLVSAAALLILAPALMMMSAALLMLSFASSGRLLANLIMLASAIAAFVAASLFLAPIIGPMFAVAGALLVFGAAIGVVGTGLISLSAGVTAVVASIIGMILSVVAGLVTFVNLIGDLAEAIGANLIGGIIRGIVGMVKALIEGIGDIALSIIGTFKKVLGIHSPSTVFEGLGGNIVGGLCGGISDGLPQVSSISKLLGSTVTSSAEEGINEGKEGLLGSINGLFDDIGAAAPEMTPEDSLFSIFSGSGVNVSEIENVADAYDSLHESVASIGSDTDIESVLGNFEGFSTNVDFSSIDYGAQSFDNLNASITQLDSEGVSNLNESLENLVIVVSDNLDTVSIRTNEMVPLMLNCGEAFINALVNGVNSKANDAANAAVFVVEGLISAIRGLLPRVLQIGEEIGNNLIKGARTSLDEHSPSKEFADIGEFSVIGLLDSIRNRLDDVRDAGKSIGEALLDSTEESLSNYGDMMDNYSVAPVIDMGLNTSGFSGISALSMMHSASNSMNSKPSSTNQNGFGAPIFNIYQQPGQDPQDLARIINRELGRLLVV